MSDFPPGFCIDHGGQIYRPLGVRERITATGTIEVVDWETNCATCGAHLVVFTALTFRHPTRRCQACKSPGTSVKKERRERALQRAEAAMTA